MKILFLVSSLNAGGAERVACTLANAWVEQGNEVVLVPCFSQGTGKSFYPLDARVQVHWLSQSLPKNKYLARLLKPLALRRLMKSVGADVAVSFLTNVNVIAILAKLGLSLPLVVSERSDPRFKKISLSLKFLRRYLYPKATAVMVQTKAVSEVFQQEIASCQRLYVMPNPLPKALVKKTPNLEAAPIVVAMGRLVDSKQVDQLIRLFAKVHTSYPQWSLRIYGEGPEKERLASLIIAQGMQDSIHLMGNTVNPWEAMREASILAITSRLEGFPNVMLEGMACGLPVIAYDCPSGPKELSQDGQVASLIPLNDEEQFAQALAKLMGSAELRKRLAFQGQEAVYQRYSQESVLQQWDHVLKEMVKQ